MRVVFPIIILLAILALAYRQNYSGEGSPPGGIAGSNVPVDKVTVVSPSDMTLATTATSTTRKTVPQTRYKKLDVRSAAVIAREIVANVSEVGASGGRPRRIALVEIKALVDELWKLHRRGNGLVTNSQNLYEEGILSRKDQMSLKAVESRILEDPKLGLELESLFRHYDMMKCETVDAVFRSWLVSG